MLVDSIYDVVIEDSSSFEDDDRVTSSVSFSSNSVERITLTGSSDINATYSGYMISVLTGNKGSNVLTGGNGTNVLFGGGGNDFLYGGTRYDELHGGAGADAMYGGGAIAMRVMITRPSAFVRRSMILQPTQAKQRAIPTQMWIIWSAATMLIISSAIHTPMTSMEALATTGLMELEA